MESAILLCVPEAEKLVREWRQKGDPSAAHGVPAHVTLLYPFLPVEALDDGVTAELAWFFRGVDAFPIRFTNVRHVEHAGVVRIEPSSDALVQLTRALARRWPECGPTTGTGSSDDAVPHLTIVQTEDRALRRSAANAVSPGLPFETVASSASLWVKDADGEWTEHTSFDFGPPE